MAIEIRPATADEMPELLRIARLSLALDDAGMADLRPEWTQCAFDDDRLATSYGRWPFTMRLNGAAVPIAAVTMVSTLPIYRRRGNLRQIMATDFRFLHESGGPAIAVLYASLAAIYQRYGYGIVSTHYRYQVEPRYLAFSRPRPLTGRLVEVTEREAGLLNELLQRFRAPRNGYIHRSRGMWQEGALARPSAGQTLTVLIYEDGGAPQGYLIYTTGRGSFPQPEVSQALNVRDLVWLTSGAYQAFWEHLGRFDLVNEVTWDTVPADDPLPHLVLEPRMLRATARDGLLARIVDLPRALNSRPYGAPGALTFEVVDELCPWNAGRWRLETDGTQSTVTRTEAAAQVTLPVSTLATLLFGQLSAGEAAHMGRLDAGEPAVLGAWDAVFRTAYRPFCADFF